MRAKNTKKPHDLAHLGERWATAIAASEAASSAHELAARNERRAYSKRIAALEAERDARNRYAAALFGGSRTTGRKSPARTMTGRK